jgi:hypothetical protein
MRGQMTNFFEIQDLRSRSILVREAENSESCVPVRSPAGAPMFTVTAIHNVK